MRTVVAHVEIQGRNDRSCRVTWTLEGPPVAVDVATGPTANHLDHRHETTVPAGQSSLELAVPAGARLFVSVAPHGGGPAVVAADRRIGFEGATNFRDLGGYRTRTESRVRWGKIFRADSLHRLSSTDLVLYRQLGLKTVFDLRTDRERAERPNPVESRALTIVGRPNGVAAATPPGSLSAADGERFLRDLYLGLIEHAAEQIGQLFQAFAGSDALPAVFHCHAGKDRTGIVAALLLEALEVEREIVLDDYELTSRYWLRNPQDSSFERLIEAGLTPEAAAGAFTAPRWAMQSALEGLDADHGGIVRYLTGPAGMGPRDIEALRRRLVYPAGDRSS